MNSNIKELSEAVESTYSIECECCYSVEKAVADVTNPRGAAEDFASNGWKVVDGEVLCSDCQY